ncbi:thioredoxin domain-containing protein 2 [Marmota marmota marmota]|nr:thioredoxin domain-containing protein 2 [Marmota marmota marmota]
MTSLASAPHSPDPTEGLGRAAAFLGVASSFTFFTLSIYFFRCCCCSESPLQVLPNKGALRVPEFLDTAKAKEKTFVPGVSHALQLATGRSQSLQQSSDLPRFSAKPPQSPQFSKTTAKTVLPKRGSIPKSPADPAQPKPGSTPKLLAKAMQLKLRNPPKAPANITEPLQGHSLQASEKGTQPRKGDSPKSLDKAIHARVGKAPKSFGQATQSRLGIISKAFGQAFQPRVGSVPKSLEEATEATVGMAPKSTEETFQPMLGSVPASLEETTQPEQGDVPEPSEEALLPKDDDLCEPEDKAPEPLDEDLVKVILDKEDLQEVLTTAGERLVAVEFSATWCGPCRHIRPLFHALSLRHKDVVFLEVDIDVCEELVKDFEVFSLPTFQFYKKEEKVGEFSGALIEKLEAAIAELK